MGLLKRAENLQAYAKIGILGFPGSGKTFTGTTIAIGLANAMGRKPIGFFDTETGSDFLISKVRNEGLELLQVKSRSFVDLLSVIKEAEEGCSVLIIDSITHCWRELCESYQKKLNRKRLEFQDWAKVKGEWSSYTDAFINSRLNIIVCGRSGFEWEFDFNEDGTKDLVKVGTKMKVESEFGFEPSLVIEMERVTPAKQEMDAIKGIKDMREKKQRKQTFSPKVGSQWIHRAHILKDRTDTINGQHFDNPDWSCFLPHFSALNIGGTHVGVDTTRTSEDLFDTQGDGTWKQKQNQKQIALEKIQGALTELWPGTTKEEKSMKGYMIRTVFNTRSWTEVEGRPLSELEEKAKMLDDFAGLYGERITLGDAPGDELATESWATVVEMEKATKELVQGDDDVLI